MTSRPGRQPPHDLPPGRRDTWGAAAALAVGLFVLALSWSKLGSVDTGYHVAYGRHFLEHGRIVDVDPFLYPQNARPFVNANWGAQVIMALAERAGGPAGLALLRTLLLAAVFACAAALLRRAGVGWTGVAAAWLLMAVAAYERFSERPELFSYALMAALLLLLARGIGSWRGIALAGLMQLAWVNLHSYFLVGLFMTGAMLAGEIARGLVAGASWDRAAWRRRTRLLAAALAVQTAACFVNPWHYQGAIFPIQTLRYLKEHGIVGGEHGRYDSARSWSAISEFHAPFTFIGEAGSARTIHAYLVLLGVAGIGVIAALATGRPGEALLIALMLLMSTQMRRNIAQFALVAAPLSILAIRAALQRTFLPTARLRTVVAVGLILASGWWLSGLVTGRFYFDERRINRELGAGFSERIFSRDATTWLAGQAALTPNLFVDVFSSSNTLLWLPPRLRLYADTNTFACDDRTLGRAFDVSLGRIDHAAFLDESGVNVVLLRPSTETQALVRSLQRDSQWALVYFDRSSVVFARRTEMHRDLIAAHAPRPDSLDAESWIRSAGGGAYDRALSLGSMANVPLALGWDDRARPLLAEAVRLAPDYHEGWYNLGVCHGNLGNAARRAGRMDEAGRAWREAIRCFEQSLVLNPDHAAAIESLRITRHNLGVLERGAGSPS